MAPDETPRWAEVAEDAAEVERALVGARVAQQRIDVVARWEAAREVAPAGWQQPRDVAARGRGSGGAASRAARPLAGGA
jgi:hypothetical protein